MRDWVGGAGVLRPYRPRAGQVHQTRAVLVSFWALLVVLGSSEVGAGPGSPKHPSRHLSPACAVLPTGELKTRPSHHHCFGAVSAPLDAGLEHRRVVPWRQSRSVSVRLPWHPTSTSQQQNWINDNLLLPEPVLLPVSEGAFAAQRVLGRAAGAWYPMGV